MTTLFATAVMLIASPFVDGGKGHTFIHISDTEINSTTGHEAWTRDIRDYARNRNAAFIVHTGDICYRPGLENHIRLMNDENMGRPVHYLLGNHDLVDGETAEGLFESIYGDVWHSFDLGGVHYVFTPMPSGDHRPSYSRQNILDWLAADLSKLPAGTPVIAFNHDLQREWIDNEFREYNLKGWFYGHWHNQLLRREGGVLTVSTAAPDKGGINHSTSAFREVHVSPRGEITTNLRYTYIDNSIAVTLTPGGGILVNTYDSSSPTRRVSFTLGDGKKTIRKGELSRLTDWAWGGDLGAIAAEYADKTLWVDVTTLFENGETARTTRTFVHSADMGEDLRTGGDWTNLLGDSHHGGVGSDTATALPRLAWATNIGANIFFSSPIVLDGTLYVGAVDEDLRGQGGIYALDAGDGRLKWHFRTRNSVPNSIAADSGKIFAQDAEGWLYAVDAASGDLAWETKLDNAYLPGVMGGLACRDGVVFAGDGAGFAAYDSRTGEKKWANTEWLQGEAQSSTISADDKIVITGSQWRGMYGHDARTGELLWTLSEEGISNRGSTPAIHGDLAWFLSAESFFVVDIRTGAIVVRKKLPFSVDVTSTPLLTDDLILFGSADEGLIALDRKTLDVKWKVGALPALVYTAPYTRYPARTIESSPVRIGRHAIWGASDGWLRAVDLETGRLAWSFDAGAPLFGAAAISGEAMFACDFGGNIYAFSLSE